MITVHRWAAYLLVTFLFPLFWAADLLKGSPGSARYRDGLAWAKEKYS